MFIEPRMFYFSNAGGVACGLLFGAITYRVTCHADGVGGGWCIAFYKHFIPTGFELHKLGESYVLNHGWAVVLKMRSECNACEAMQATAKPDFAHALFELSS